MPHNARTDRSKRLAFMKTLRRKSCPYLPSNKVSEDGRRERERERDNVAEEQEVNAERTFCGSAALGPEPRHPWQVSPGHARSSLMHLGCMPVSETLGSAHPAAESDKCLHILHGFLGFPAWSGV